jgi:transcriptional regulator NrdR family protein
MQFYDLEKLYKKLQKSYEKGEIFRDFIEGENAFPFEVPLKKVQQKDIQTNSTLLMQELQKLKATKRPIT